MSDYFNSKSCHETNIIKSKKKHSKSQYHQARRKSINSRFYITNPKFLDAEDIFKKHTCDYNKKFGYFLILCIFDLVFDDLTYDFILSRM